MFRFLISESYFCVARPPVGFFGTVGGARGIPITIVICFQATPIQKIETLAVSGKVFKATMRTRTKFSFELLRAIARPTPRCPTFTVRPPCQCRHGRHRAEVSCTATLRLTPFARRHKRSQGVCSDARTLKFDAATCDPMQKASHEIRRGDHGTLPRYGTVLHYESFRRELAMSL
jgi:hypothetical protein